MWRIFFWKNIISCEHNRASTFLINSECFIITCRPKAGSYYWESQRFWGGGFVGCCSFPEWCPNSFFGRVLTMAKICFSVKMLWSNEQLCFCVTFLLWYKRFWVRNCPFDPWSVYKWSLYVSAFYTSLSNSCDRNSTVAIDQTSPI